MDIRTLALERCPIRFGGRRKQRFLKELDPIFEEAGYPSHTLEKRGFRGKTRNQIYAFEKTAKLYIAVPYDTPERLFWHKSDYYPLDGNRSLNKNMLATYVPALLFYALILLFVMLVTPQVDDLILQVIANLAVLGATLLLMWLLFHGVANRLYLRILLLSSRPSISCGRWIGNRNGGSALCSSTVTTSAVRCGTAGFLLRETEEESGHHLAQLCQGRGYDRHRLCPWQTSGLFTECR
ncbi:MAG: hypothetical protein ACLVJ6_10785 [Merdibacter sp.]